MNTRKPLETFSGRITEVRHEASSLFVKLDNGKHVTLKINETHKLIAAAEALRGSREFVGLLVTVNVYRNAFLLDYEYEYAL